VETATEDVRGRCRVVQIKLGEHLLFGAQQPSDEHPWLQVGPIGPRTAANRVLSAVTGQLWVTAESGGGRVMVENLSKSVTIEIRSKRLPENPKLYPVDVDEPARDRWLGTAIAALQTPTAELVLRNQGHEFVLWTMVITDQWNATFAPSGTANVRDDAQRLVSEAAMRIQLGSRDHLNILRAFIARPDVRERLRTSATLRTFLEKESAKRTYPSDPEEFCARQLDRVAENQATHELHRLILEGLGQPPDHAAHYYTEIVLDLIEPDRERHSRRGGSGGLSKHVSSVRAHFRFRPEQLADYLGVGRGRDRGPDRGPDVSPG
jgi:hypothetical protein